MMRLDDLLKTLGPAGIVGVGVLLSCLPFYFSALRPAERELAAERLAAARARAPAPARPAAERGQTDELGRVYRRFPPLTKLPDELGRLYGLARAAHLELLQGEYRLEDGGGPLTAYRIALPLRGPYPRIREFLRATLETMPIASIDALQFERKKVTDDQLQAQLRLTLYFRSGGQIATGETMP